VKLLLGGRKKGHTVDGSTRNPKVANPPFEGGRERLLIHQHYLRTGKDSTIQTVVGLGSSEPSTVQQQYHLSFVAMLEQISGDGNYICMPENFTTRNSLSFGLSQKCTENALFKKCKENLVTKIVQGL